MTTPKLVQLDPPGPYITPDVVRLSNVALGYPPESGLPMRFVLILDNKAELHLPVTPEAAREIRDTLNQTFPPDEKDHG